MSSKHFIVNENLVKLRKAVGLVQKEFSFAVGIKRSLLGAYEEHRAEVKTDVIKAAIKKGFLQRGQLYDFMFSKSFKPSPKKTFKKTWVELSIDDMKNSFQKTNP